MRELLNGQTLKFDAHDWGSGKPVAFGDGLHLHKIMNNDKKYKGVEVLIPIDSDAEIIFRKSYDEGIERSIKREITHVLNKDAKKRREFARTLFNQIQRFSYKMSPKERSENLRKGANRIAKHFQLGDSFVEEIIKYDDGSPEKWTTSHKDKDNKVIYVSQDLGGETIKVGENEKMLFDENLFIVQ